MKLKKGDRFKNYIGRLCFISYIRLDIVKLTYIGPLSEVEVWDKEEFINSVNLNKFFQQERVKIDRTNITDHLIEYQLNMIGKTIPDAQKLDDWYHQFTLTQKQHDLFKGYAIPLLKKVFKCSKTKAEQTFEWFNLNFGLRIKN